MTDIDPRFEMLCQMMVQNAKTIARLEAENERLKALRHAFRNADAEDWSRLFRLLDDSAYGRFWTAALKEAREALADD